MASGPITSWQIDAETVETVTDFILGGSKITEDDDCSHEIKRCLLLGRKVMTNLDSILKSSCIYQIDFKEDNNHVVTVNRDPEQYACTSIEEDIESLNKLFDWWTQIPYDHYHEWLSETNDTLKRRQK